MKMRGNPTSLDSSMNLSRATVIESNWILEIVTFMLMWVLRGDNSVGDKNKHLPEVGQENLQYQQERLRSPQGGALGVGCEEQEVVRKLGWFRETREEQGGEGEVGGPFWILIIMLIVPGVPY